MIVPYLFLLASVFGTLSIFSMEQASFGIASKDYKRQPAPPEYSETIETALHYPDLRPKLKKAIIEDSKMRKYAEEELGLAAYNGKLHTVQALVDAGVTSNAQDEAGDSPLILATKSGQPEIVKFLLDHGADPKLKNKDGRTALKVARLILSGAHLNLSPDAAKKFNTNLKIIKNALAKAEETRF
jgi:hypothetical protein